MVSGPRTDELVQAKVGSEAELSTPDNRLSFRVLGLLHLNEKRYHKKEAGLWRRCQVPRGRAFTRHQPPNPLHADRLLAEVDAEALQFDERRFVDLREHGDEHTP